MKSQQLDTLTMFGRSLATLLFFGFMSIPCTLLSLPLLLSSFIYKAVLNASGGSGKKPCVVIFAASKSKSLHYLRLFKDRGYRTVAVGSDFFVTCGTGWSIYCDKYYTVTAPLTEKTEGQYIKEVVDIVVKEKADIMMQIEPRYTPCDVKANEILNRIYPSCTILAFDTETYKLLDNKVTFNEKLHELGVRAPKSKIIKSSKDLLEHLSLNPNVDFILKPVQYLQKFRVNIDVPKGEKELMKFMEIREISEKRQFILQEKLIRPEYCCCTLVVDSRMIAQNVCDQAVDRMWQNSIKNPRVEAWVKDFLEKYDSPLTGFLTFDFMCSPKDGLPYPLECNPRVQTSHMLFLRDDNVIQELNNHLADKTYSCPVIKPKIKETFWLLREISFILLSLLNFDFKTVVERSGVVARGKEAVFEWLDPLPFLILNFVQIPGRIIANLFGKQLYWTEVDYMCGNPLIN